ncbi:hypothetical protein MNBD_GAMMA09-1466 [hydrothermal vent metagenome]|uniref:Calx-beta domain-containing protein n=1 Tax=hydrothermal vent metagenome TaxID=652676 RepID=A0A3B0Y223_9ZZZZ
MNSNIRCKKLKINKALHSLAGALLIPLIASMGLIGLQGCGSSGGGGGAASATPTLTVAAGSVIEGDTVPATSPNMTFSVSLKPAASKDVVVTYSTVDKTATSADSDYMVSNGDTITILAGNTSGTISIPVISDDKLEFDEQFDLQITATNATVASGSSTVTGTILSDDSLAGYYTGDSSIIEATGQAAVARTNNIKVIADINRLSIIDLTNNFVYIATINAFPSQTAFTATARVYEAGNYKRMTTITGVINTNKSLDLTLDGTNSGGGDFTAGTIALTYSTKNGDAPLVFGANGVFTWQDNPFSVSLRFGSDTVLSVIATSGIVPGVLSNCDSSESVNVNNVITEAAGLGRIRSFSASVNNNCVGSVVDGTVLNGYFTTYDSDPAKPLAEDRLLFIWFNDNGVHAASLPVFP